MPNSSVDLPQPGLADDADELAGLDVEAHAVDRADSAALSMA